MAYFDSVLSPRQPYSSQILDDEDQVARRYAAALAADRFAREHGMPPEAQRRGLDPLFSLMSGQAGDAAGGIAQLTRGPEALDFWRNQLAYQRPGGAQPGAGEQKAQEFMNAYVHGNEAGWWPGTETVGANVSDVFGPAAGAVTKTAMEFIPGKILGPYLRTAGRVGVAGVRGAEAVAARAAEMPPPARFGQAGEINPKRGAPVPGEPAILQPAEGAPAAPAESAILQPPVEAPSAVVPTRSRRRVESGENAGQYVGGPPGVNTQQAFGAIVRRYKDAMLQGILGRDFYINSSADVLARAGGDVPNVADPFTGNLAILSRSNTVGGNAAMSAKGRVQAVTGAPVETGRFPARDSAAVQALYQNLQQQYRGLKRDPFAEQLSVAWAPGRIGRGVNDMHEAELMGYPSGTVGGEAQHAFMDEVRARAIEQANAEKLGGFDDWHTGNAQAAAWTGNKIRRGDLSPGDAAKDYSHYLPKQEANATYESLPGVGTGHLPNAPAGFAEKEAFHADPSGQWGTSASGRDIGYTAAQLLPGPDSPGMGHFEGVVNPATIARPIVGTQNVELAGPGKTGKPIPTVAAMPESAKDALNLVEGSRGFADVQNASAWHKLYDSEMPLYNGVNFHVPGMSEAKMKQIAPIFEKKGYYLASSPEGVTVMANESTPHGAAFRDEIYDLLKNAGYKRRDLKLNFGRLESGYVDYSGAWKAGEGSGAATRKLLELVDKAPATAKLLEGSDPYKEAFVARNARDLAAQGRGWGAPRADVTRAREIFAKLGWQGLRDAVNSGLLPMAAAVGIGAGSQLLSDYEQQ